MLSLETTGNKNDAMRDFIMGQRRILGVVDQMVPLEVFNLVEVAINEGFNDGLVVQDTIFHRYLNGELTAGIIPRERMMTSDPDFARMEWFFWALEMLRMRADAGAKPAKGKVKDRRKLSKRDKLTRGEFGPFTEIQLAGEPLAMCLSCHDRFDIELIMAMRGAKCPGCGARSHEDDAETGVAGVAGTS